MHFSVKAFYIRLLLLTESWKLQKHTKIGLLDFFLDTLDPIKTSFRLSKALSFIAFFSYFDFLSF